MSYEKRSWARHSRSSQNNKFAYRCNFPEKREGSRSFLPADKHESFPKLCVTRHAQSTQNNKFAISLQYLKENVKDVVDFLHGDKHQRFLWTDTTNSGMCGLACLNYPNNNFAIYFNIFRKQWVMKLIFCMQISMKVFSKLVLWFLMVIVKHF